MTERERLQCNGISIDGLNPPDRQRIEEVGFDRWLNETADAPPAKKPTSKVRAKIALCRSGSKCLNASCRRAAPTTGRSQFCTSACAASSRARDKRQADNAIVISNQPEVASGSSMDTGLEVASL
jgi:hypothetical protein